MVSMVQHAHIHVNVVTMVSVIHTRVSARAPMAGLDRSVIILVRPAGMVPTVLSYVDVSTESIVIT